MIFWTEILSHKIQPKIWREKPWSYPHKVEIVFTFWCDETFVEIGPICCIINASI